MERSDGPRAGNRHRRGRPPWRLRPARRRRRGRALTLRWRWAVFQVSRLLGYALIRATRTLAYGSAGLLKRDQLGRAIAGRWSQWGLDERYALLGLFGWEEPFVRRFLKPDDRILIVGSGSGREVIALRRDGYNVEGLEPAAAAAALSRDIMKKAGVDARIRIGGIETVELDGHFDLFIFSWYCYSYIAHRPTRIAALPAWTTIPLRTPATPGIRATAASAAWRSSSLITSPVSSTSPRATVTTM